jgi:acyl carrier protein
VLDQVTAIWAQVLNREPVESDDFFKIGGTSLKAARVVGKVRKALGIRLDLEVMFTSPVLADFAKRVDEQTQSTPR